MVFAWQAASFVPASSVLPRRRECIAVIGRKSLLRPAVSAVNPHVVLNASLHNKFNSLTGVN